MNFRKLLELKFLSSPFARYLMRIFSFICILHLSSNTKKENYNNNVERRVASIDATLGPSGEKGKVSQIIAKKIRVSTATYERGKNIIEKGTDEQKIVSEEML